MNRLSISWERVTPTGADEPPAIQAVIKIDGEPLVDYAFYGVATALYELDRSRHEGGDFFLITCTCGIAGCAGIWEGIEVRHLGESIEWIYRNPFPDPETDASHETASSKKRATKRRRAARLPTRTFHFDRTQYCDAIEEGMQRAHAIIRASHEPLQVLPDLNAYFLGLPERRG